MATTDLTAQRLRELVRYDKRTGVFTWRIQPCPAVKVGDTAGSLHRTHGYVFIQIDGCVHRAHRLAVLYVTGEHPGPEVDHRDGKSANNVWTNLRHGSKALNMQNKRRAQSNNVSGFLGAYFNRRTGRYASKIGVNGRQVYLGTFSTATQAHAAYVSAKRRLHAGCTI